jgi:hypothetical protein
MNIYERSLALMEDLILSTPVEKLIEDSTRFEANIGKKVSEFLRESDATGINIKYANLASRAYSIQIDGENYSEIKSFMLSSHMCEAISFDYNSFGLDDCSNDDPYLQEQVA